MDFTSEAVQEIIEIEKIAAGKMHCDAEHWLNIACKLDYISLKEKETIVSLLRKWQTSKEVCKAVTFCKKEYYALYRMKEIISHTVFSSELIQRVTG